MSSENRTVDNDSNKTSKPLLNGGSELRDTDAFSQYLKSTTTMNEGRRIPPLETWHPKQVVDMDMVIKANGEWWHEGTHVTRQSLVNLFASVLWKEENESGAEYFLKTPAQKLRIKVEDAPLLINDVGIVNENIDGNELSWLEFTTTTGDVVRLDDEHPLVLRNYQNSSDRSNDNGNLESQVRPYMLVRNGLEALIGRNAFYHLTDIGQLSEVDGVTTLTLQSGTKTYQLSMPEVR